MTPLSEAQKLANNLLEAFLTADGADKEAIRPVALAAAENALAESIGNFKRGTFKILELSAKLTDAINAVGAPESRARLQEIAARLGGLADLVHEMEGMRTTWQSDAEFHQTFPDEIEVAAAPNHVPVPAASSAPLTVGDIAAVNSTAFADLSDEYVRFFRAAQYKDNASRKAAEKFAKAAIANRSRYEQVGNPLGIPWWFIAGVHLLESSYSFTTHLHNGDSLQARTHRVPAGRPAKGQPPFTWEESATDALEREGLAHLTDWSLPRALYRWEAYNGFGYRKRGIPTPYLWSYSTIYRKGKFVGDGVFSASAVSQQCGAAVLLMSLAELGEVALKMELATEGSADDLVSKTADAKAVVTGSLPNIDGVVSSNVDFQKFFAENLPGVVNFEWHEFLVKGGNHANSHLNTDPPRELWQNIVPLVRVLDRFRNQVGLPVILTSVYRSPAYNATLPGAAKSSQHMQFRAADIKVVGNGAGSPAAWADILAQYRNQGIFEGGIGRYGTFVHVDTRGFNADW